MTLEGLVAGIGFRVDLFVFVMVIVVPSFIQRIFLLDDIRIGQALFFVFVE